MFSGAHSRHRAALMPSAIGSAMRRLHRNRMEKMMLTGCPSISRNARSMRGASDGKRRISAES